MWRDDPGESAELLSVLPFATPEERLERRGLPSELEEARVSLEKARLRKKIADRIRQKGGPRPS